MTTTKIKKLNPFIINYAGTKYKESIETFQNDDLDFNKYNSFVEPFGGSFGFSRYIYMKLNKPTDKKFIIYDNDEELIAFYNHVKGMTQKECEELHNKYNELIDTYTAEEWTTKGKKLIKEVIPTIKDKYLKIMFDKNMIGGRFTKKIKKKFNPDWFEMFKYCTFIYMDVTDEKNLNSIKRKHDKKDVLIYLDPPYLNTCNSFYESTMSDYSEIIINFFVNKSKNNVLFVHERNFLLKYILNKYIYKSINKIFQSTKRTTIQDIYMKYKV